MAEQPIRRQLAIPHLAHVQRLDPGRRLRLGNRSLDGAPVTGTAHGGSRRMIGRAARRAPAAAASLNPVPTRPAYTSSPSTMSASCSAPSARGPFGAVKPTITKSPVGSALILSQLRRAAGAVRRVRLLRDDPLEPHARSPARGTLRPRARCGRGSATAPSLGTASASSSLRSRAEAAADRSPRTRADRRRRTSPAARPRRAGSRRRSSGGRAAAGARSSACPPHRARRPRRR